MKVRLKRQNPHEIGSVNPTAIPAKSLTHIRPMDSPLAAPQKPQTEDINPQPIQKKQGFNWAEIPIFAGGAEASPRIQPKISPRPEQITQQPVQRTQPGVGLSQGTPKKQQLDPTNAAIPTIQRKLTPDQIKHANRIRKARGLELLPLEVAKQLNNVEEATQPPTVAHQPVANQQPTPAPPQSDAKRSDSNFQIVQDYSGIKSVFKELKSWDKVKEQFSSDRKTMWQFFDFRQWYVDSLKGLFLQYSIAYIPSLNVDYKFTPL